MLCLRILEYIQNRLAILLKCDLTCQIATNLLGLFSFIDIHFIKLTVSKGFDAYSFILSAIRVMP